MKNVHNIDDNQSNNILPVTPHL